MKTDKGHASWRAVDARHRSADDIRPAHEVLEGDELSCSILLALRRSAKEGFALPVYDLPQITGFTLAECYSGVRMLEFARLAKIEDDPADPFGAKLVLLDEGARRPHAAEG